MPCARSERATMDLQRENANISAVGPLILKENSRGLRGTCMKQQQAKGEGGTDAKRLAARASARGPRGMHDIFLRG